MNYIMKLLLFKTGMKLKATVWTSLSLGLVCLVMLKKHRAECA